MLSCHAFKTFHAQKFFTYMLLTELSKICKNNGKVKVSEIIGLSSAGKPNSEAEAAVKGRFIDQKSKQIQDNVQWIHVHCGSYE